MIFASPYMGNIVDSLTGEKQKEMVGSFDENLYFKVVDSTGYIEKYRTFFFKSPEEFERLTQHVVPGIVKEKWAEKRDLVNIVNSLESDVTIIH